MHNEDSTTDDAPCTPPLHHIADGVAARRSVHKAMAFALVRQRLFSQSAQPAMLGRFAIIDTLGRGGMGTVFKAYDEELDRAVAIKLLHADASRRQAERLRREAQALAKLSHPNVVHVYEVGHAQGRWFIAMEFVPGRTLRKWHDEGHDWRTRVALYIEAGAGLAAVHAVGLVHRDFKPDNCIVDREGRPRVLDFGLVRDMRGSVDIASSADPGPESARASAAVGTRGYVAPEQLAGQVADARSDQFSFCASLYEALCGERPFRSTARIDPCAPLRKAAGVPETVHRAVSRGLLADPRDRWPSLEALLVELRRCIHPRGPRRLIAGLLVAGVGIGSLGYAQLRARCTGAAGQLEGVWDDAVRGQARDAIAGSALPYAADTWEQVERRLDDYASGWMSARTEACEATNVRREQSPEVMDLRIACLRSRRDALAEVVGLLVAANADRVEHAVTLAAGLPRVSHCNDVEALLAVLPPPDDPGIAADVERQRQRLQEAVARRAVGEYDEALALADAVVSRAQQLDYAPRVAESNFELGLAHREKGNYEAAFAALTLAYERAAAVGHDEPEAFAAAWLVEITGVRMAQPDEAEWWHRTASALAQRPGADPTIHGRAELNLGSVRMEQGKPKEALGHFKVGLAALERGLGARHPSLAFPQGRIGVAFREQGLFEEALLYLRRARSIVEEAYGARHPHVGALLVSEASVLHRQGERDDALVLIRRALEIQRGALGEEHPNIGAIFNNMGNMLEANGQPGEALDALSRALATWKASLGPEHPKVATAHHNIGTLLARKKDYKAALVHMKRALAIRQKVLEPLHPDLGSSFNNIGVVLGHQQELSEAVFYLEKGLEIERTVTEPKRLEVALLENNLALMQRDLGRLAPAREHFQRALDIRKELLPVRHKLTARSQAGLADVVLKKGDISRARTLAEQAIATSEAIYDIQTLAAARFVLARVLWAEGRRRDRKHAVDLAKQARRVYLDSSPDGPQPLAEVDAWLAEHARAR